MKIFKKIDSNNMYNQTTVPKSLPLNFYQEILNLGTHNNSTDYIRPARIGGN